MNADSLNFVDQVHRATNKLLYEGKYVANPLLAACTEVMSKPYDHARQIPNCSNGALLY